LLDAVLAQDPYGRVAIETLVKTGTVVVAGEVTTTCYVDIPSVVRQTIQEVGYTDPDFGFDCHSCGIMVCIEGQSPDIAMGVDEDSGKHKELGAGDQGIMYGYACNETEELMPLPIMLARRLTNRLAEARLDGTLHFLRPDGKSQVTVEYDGEKPVRIHTIVLAAQHAPDVETRVLRDAIIAEIIKAVIPPELIDRKTILHINATGRFVLGGPHADTGLTGRKIIVDTYGGMGRHGGGAFSGKDPSKVDRSASYAARHAAKNLVAAGLADRCEVQVAYGIGLSSPVSLAVSTFGTGRASDEQIVALLQKHFTFAPSGMIAAFKLRRPIYKDTARYGHFGNTGPNCLWERTDKVAALRKDMQRKG
ncbi:MAG: methionine adenosyltransferase, partial [Planctomycetota bacterium]|nr:methionine adenosyltransferase [Planctomycetota bacterium]